MLSATPPPVELLAVAGCGLLAWLLIWPPLSRLGRGMLIVACLLCLGSGVLSAVLPGVGHQTAAASAAHQTPAHQPVVRREDADFIGSQACRSCHPGAYATWHDSFHRTMTQTPTPTAVVGRFDGVMMQVAGRAVRMFRQGDAFYTEFPAPSSGPNAGQRVQKRIVLMTGAHHQQAYWFETGTARELALAPVVWVRAEAKWVPFTDIFVQPAAHRKTAVPPTEVKSAGQWNRTCIRCHSTQPRERFGDSDVAEHGIACEACHGPGRSHVARWRSPLLRYAAHVSRALAPATGLAKTAGDHIVQPSRLGHRRGSEVCGQCHAPLAGDPERFDDEQDHGRTFRPGDVLAQHAVLVRGVDHTAQSPRAGPPQAANARPQGNQMGAGHLPLSGLFFGDGGLRVSGREFAALSRSACYQRGKLGCMTCHQMHGPRDERDDQLGLGMRGDAACTGCHSALAAVAAAETHSGHPSASSGARCMNCHMPNTAWGLLKATRDHEIRSPNIGRDRAAGRPNACNLCHLDKTEAWAAAGYQRIFAARRGGRDDGRKWRRPDARPEVAASVDWLLTGEPGLRALIAWHLAWPPAVQVSGRGWQAPLLAVALSDPYAAIRRRAAMSLRALGSAPPADFDASAPLHLRRASVRRALARWLEVGAEKPPRPTLLQDGRGRLNVQAMRALMGHADHRDVSLEE